MIYCVANDLVQVVMMYWVYFSRDFWQPYHDLRSPYGSFEKSWTWSPVKDSPFSVGNFDIEIILDSDKNLFPLTKL